jgi:hypothetical protein
MRKTLLMVVASCALLAVAPAGALAHGGRRHHSHRSRAHRRTFGADQGMGQNTGTSPSAGTVQSFMGGVLTIAMTNGPTVSGQVSNFTDIVCESAPTAMQGTGSWQDHHDSNGGGGSWSGGDSGAGNQDQSGNDTDNDDQGSQACDTSALTTGAVVQEAVLSLTGAGATWDRIVLAPTSSSSTSPPSSTSPSPSSGS